MTKIKKVTMNIKIMQCTVKLSSGDVSQTTVYELICYMATVQQ